MDKMIRTISWLGYSRIICLPKSWVMDYKKVLIKTEFDETEKKEILKLIPMGDDSND